MVNSGDRAAGYKLASHWASVVGQTKLTWTGAEGQIWNVGIGPLQLCQNHRGDQSVLFVGPLGYSPPPTPQINTIVLEVLRGWRTKRGVS